MDPDACCPCRGCLDRETVINVTGVRVVDGHAALAREIHAAGIAGLLLVGLLLEPFGFLEQVRGEATAPDRSLERDQLVGVPLAQIHQEVTQLTALLAQVQLAQALAHPLGELLQLQPSAGDLLQQFQPLQL